MSTVDSSSPDTIEYQYDPNVAYMIQDVLGPFIGGQKIAADWLSKILHLDHWCLVDLTRRPSEDVFPSDTTAPFGKSSRLTP